MPFIPHSTSRIVASFKAPFKAPFTASFAASCAVSCAVSRAALTTAIVCALSLTGDAQPAAPPARRQPTATALPKTPNGRPDLQGMWTNQTLTRLQRPAELAGKLSLTEAEAAAYAKKYLEESSTDRRDGGAAADVNRAYPDYFLDRGTGLAVVDHQRRTSLIVDPANGLIPPLTAAAQARNAARRGGGAAGGDSSRNYDDPEARPLAERCLLSFGSSSGPPMLPVLYNNHYQFVQTPEYLLINVEMVHDARIIPLDGRPHAPSSIRKWMGDSVGHWEGDTLVVDTTNFSPKVSFQGSSPDLHVIERFTRVDADTIIYRFTIDDPATFTAQWSGEIPLRATDDMLYEYACHEANHSLPGILSGARFQEKEAAGKK
jgi:hypothetical protein